ncbi:MAG: hypothetical protein GEU86_09455 [Actinophytocola sp.]|nr:hypothetical protein [Actinophytocola sp.]
MAVRAPRPVVLTVVVALLATAAALATVVALRSERDTSGDEIATEPNATSAAPPAATCGGSPCGVLTSLPVGSATVELLADEHGENSRLRILGTGSETVLETALSEMGVRVTQRSLVCQDGPTAACLVRGGRAGGVIGEVFADTDGKWEPAERPYVSNAGFVDLLHVAADRSPEIGIAHHPDCEGSADDCTSAVVVVEVFGLDGVSLGCTPWYGSLTQLPGWPDVSLTDDDLRRC